MEGIRGNDISMIFQEPMTSLNPLITVGRQIGEAIALHRALSRRDAMDKAVEMLRRVQIPEPERRAHAYPHQLSGGMRQRVMIAMALSCNPKVLIADEPTTALDVTIQAQILDLMRELQETFGTAIILITHDMGVVAENADRVVVMYAGRKVEEASAKPLFESPGIPTPRTSGLDPQSRCRGACPHPPDAAERDQGHGAVAVQPAGRLHFAPRCGFATDQCRAAYPPLLQDRPGHWIACWHADRCSMGVMTADFSERRPHPSLHRGRGRDGRRPDLNEKGASRCSRSRTSRSISRSTRACFPPLGPGLCGGRRLVPHRPRRDPGAGWRERLRQVDGRPHPPQTAGADRREDPGRGEDITDLDQGRMLPYRRQMQMIYQDPYASLNPRMSAGEIVGEPMIIHRVANAGERRDRVAACSNGSA